MIGKLVVATVVVALASAAYSGWQLTARGAYESAEYTVLEAERPFEVREYPDLMLATTGMRFESQGNDGSFMRLFRYISGANDREQKIAMTTPVFMESAAGEAPGQMGFVIPKDVARENVPKPTQEGVQIHKRVGGKFAVIRFAGRINSESVADAEAKLRNWMNSKGLVADGEAECAGYDPPWTPGPLRRNEILIRVQPH